jgi:UrcA family protein
MLHGIPKSEPLRNRYLQWETAMNITTLSARNRHFNVSALAIVGAMLAGTAAFAQPMEEITVIAPHQVHRKVIGRSTIGAPIEEISLSHHVQINDLDLSKPEDQAALKARIAEVAKQGCDELDGLFPFDKDQGKNRECVRDAVNQAQAQVVAAMQSPKPR